MKDDLAHRTGTGRLDLESHALEREREQRAGNRLINHIFTAVKAGRLYAPNNLGFKKPLDALMKALNDFFKTEEAVVLETYLHCLFLNREKVRTEFHNYTHTKFFIDILKNRGVEGLSFRRGLREEELKKFILLLAGVDGREAITLKGFQQRLSDQNISHISVTQFSAAAKRAAEEQLQNTRQFAKRTFFQCIYNFRGIVYKEKSEQKTYTKREEIGPIDCRSHR